MGCIAGKEDPTLSVMDSSDEIQLQHTDCESYTPGPAVALSTNISYCNDPIRCIGIHGKATTSHSA